MYEQEETSLHPSEVAFEATASEDASEAAKEETLPRGEGAETAEDSVDSEAVNSDSAQSSDPASEAVESDQTAASELECLRRELRQLEERLETQTRMLQGIGAECAEFRELYPEQSPDELPDEVWENVGRGIPLAAAFALSERRRQRAEELARRANLENRRRSAGAIERAQSGYLSPDEVRSMSREEVRANYQSILLSMQKW